jgi:hypothetical protein
MQVNAAAAELNAEEDGVDVPILDANDEPAMFGGTDVERDGETVTEGAEPVTVRVCGMNSKTYAKAEAWQRKQFAALGGRNATDKESTEIWCGFLARLCKGWKGFFDDAGEPIRFTTENATDVFLKLPFVRRRIASAAGNGRLYRQKTASG